MIALGRVLCQIALNEREKPLTERERALDEGEKKPCSRSDVLKFACICKPCALRSHLYRGDHFDLLEKNIFFFYFSILYFLFFYLCFCSEVSHDPIGLEEGALTQAAHFTLSLRKGRR